jgi:hypothetical protein
MLAIVCLGWFVPSWRPFAHQLPPSAIKSCLPLESWRDQYSEKNRPAWTEPLSDLEMLAVRRNITMVGNVRKSVTIPYDPWKPGRLI